jgi:hypothetical protein
MDKIGKFLGAIWADWLARMSGPLTVPFTILAFHLSSRAGILFAILAVLAALLTTYRVWVKEYDRAEAERAKNEDAPHMTIDVLCNIPHGSLSQGIKDLFFNINLVLGTPSHVTIENFALTIFDAVQSVTVIAMDDMTDWELVRKLESGIVHFDCVPLIKELQKRGDPIQGWIHFQLPGGMTEHILQTRGLTIKVNCTHGTCYYTINGAYVRVEPEVKGHMRKKLAL